jgi:hypothetical protein
MSVATGRSDIRHTLNVANSAIEQDRLAWLYPSA